MKRFYIDETGSVFSSDELNSKYQEAKKICPWLSPAFYRHQMEEHTGLKEIVQALVRTLIMAKRFDDAAMVMGERNGYPIGQARLEILMIAQDYGIMA